MASNFGKKCGSKIVHLICRSKMNFWFLQTRFLWIKPKTLVKNGWLTKLSFPLKSLRGAPNFNPIRYFFSKVIVLTDDNDDNENDDNENDRQWDTVVKIIFSYSRRLKTSRFYGSLKIYFLHKTNTFSYDKNLKNQNQNLRKYSLKPPFWKTWRFFSVYLYCETEALIQI